MEPKTPLAWGPGISFVGSVSPRGGLGSILYNMANCEYMRSNCWDLNMYSSLHCASIIMASLSISGLRDFRNQSTKKFPGIYALIILHLYLHSWIQSKICIALLWQKDVLYPKQPPPWIWPSNGKILRDPLLNFWILLLMDVFGMYIWLLAPTLLTFNVLFWWLRVADDIIFYRCFELFWLMMTFSITFV